MPPSLRPLSDIDARSVADTYGLPERYFYLPNQFWRHKNHALVLQALSLLRQRGLPVVVAASGKQSDPRDPTHFPRIVALIQSLRLQDDFRLLGLVPYDHLGALMQASVALLNPSTFEGWSTTVEEARTLGVPMILSDLKVHREQACGDAVYFDRNSAEALAAVLAAASLSAPPRLTDGCAGAEQRVAGFARRFTEVARSAMSDRVEVRARG
jgi:glycosyltransferase involved in cell wall biosynthesis